MAGKNKSLREEIIEEAKKRYGVSLEHLWPKFPEDAVFRHKDNKKWFAVFMEVKREKLGLPGEDWVEIMDLKVEPEMAGLLTGASGCLPGYHMNKKSWITVLLDGTVDKAQILSLLDISFSLTDSGKKGKTAKGIITDWLIPANPKYYDIQTKLKENPKEPFIWKQSSNVKAGHNVYMYLGAPIKAVLYKCRVLEADIPYQYEDKNLSISRAMRLQLLEQYDEKMYTMEKLKKHGVYAVRGPRSMPESLIREMKIH